MPGLTETTHSLDNTINSISELELLLKSENRKLQAKDIKCVEKIFMEMANKVDFVTKSNKIQVDEVGNMMKRIKLYASDRIEIRVHIFNKKDEDVIHQHGQFFITTCLVGGYSHSLYALQNSDSEYFVFERLENGVFKKAQVEKGTWIKLCSQPFEAGQTLFISPHAFHTVEIINYPIVTFVVRDTEDTVDNVKFIDTKNELKYIPLIRPISDKAEVDAILTVFKEALLNFAKYSY